MPRTRKAEPAGAVAFRPAGVTRQRMDDLIRWWDDTQTGVICRAIEQAWLSEDRKRNPVEHQ
ncbi:MAG: hypothetical protein EXR62_10945 [Chloroflexi bacterium]|nr:hypothetical protein [Chloroflexota bacterium]